MKPGDLFKFPDGAVCVVIDLYNCKYGEFDDLEVIKYIHPIDGPQERAFSNLKNKIYIGLSEVEVLTIV